MTTLAQHIASDPDSRGYAQMTNYEVYQDLVTKRRPGERQVTLKEFGDLVDTNVAGRVIKAMTNYGASSADDAPLVQYWLDILKSPSGAINVNNTKVRAMLDAFEAAGNLGMNAGDAAIVKALSDNQLSDADHYGFLSLKPSDIGEARS